ncbi:MAG: cation transporter [Spirochaetales bacterium]|nr:cation transporter [Spirochaetales bacterium]
MLDRQRARAIYRTSLIAVAGNALLSVSKIAAGLFSGSLAVTGDGIDSATDIITSFVTMIAAQIISKPPDVRHPYGHRRAEAVATKIVAFIIFFIGVQLIITTVTGILEGKVREIPGILALVVTLISIAGKTTLAVILFREGKKNRSAMLLANAQNMRNDIFISVSVLSGLIFTYAFRMPVIDYVVAILVSLWIIKSAIQIFLESSLEVMDGLKDESLYNIIFTAVGEVPGAANPHRTRIRCIGDMYIISLDIEVHPEIKVREGHSIAAAVEEKIKERLENVYDIIVHVEPSGNVERDEKYGLSEKNIND